jgi:glycosyltransferase involved in cell wall biosynthesis
VKITIVVPIYNETDSLPIFLEMIEEAKSSEIHFLLVDNGSTREEVGKILSRESNYWTSLRTDTNLGFGGGILFGISKSSTEFVGWMPGNLKVDPREVVHAFKSENLAKEYLVKAKRTGRTVNARGKTVFAGLVQSILLKSNMFDSGGTPTVCHKDFIQGLENPPTDYVFESYVLYKARRLDMQVIRPKISYGKRVFGESHWQRGLGSEVALMRKIWISSRLWARS